MGCMSIQALSWCIKQDCDTPTTKLILFLLSNYADENNSCYPSEKHLGKLAGVSDRTVRRSLKWLSENNMVDIKPKLGTSNRYIVNYTTMSLRTGGISILARLINIKLKLNTDQLEKNMQKIY